MVLPIPDSQVARSVGQSLPVVDDENDSSIKNVTSSTKSLVAMTSPIEAERTWLERRGAHDTAFDKKLAVILQQRTDLNPYEISALIAKGRWRNIMRQGTVLMREGEPATFLAMVLLGSLVVSKGEGQECRRLHTVQAGQLVGSLEWNEPEREHLAGETVTSLEPCTFIVWDLDDLRQLLKPRPRLRANFTTMVAADLSLKFRQVQEAVPSSQEYSKGYKGK